MNRNKLHAPAIIAPREKIHDISLIKYERRNRVCNIPSSYPGGPGSNPGLITEVFHGFLSLSRQLARFYLKLFPPASFHHIPSGILFSAYPIIQDYIRVV
jgi:hypothetical protein